ncbi:MAG: rRNA maturation RNase YbeY [Candidatus Omnitrophica bacterium]|nr:rRNA maturation RNase YbeY [Candidatus Omnitrophota bacterium]
MKIEITNQQKLKRIHLNRLSQRLKKVFKILGLSSKKASFLLCDNSFIKKINLKYFKKNIPTDVIAFSLKDEADPDYLGEIIVSVEQACIVCGRYALSFQEELFLYLVHGILHLLGYNDKTKKDKEKMHRKEKEILVKLGRIRND